MIAKLSRVFPGLNLVSCFTDFLTSPSIDPSAPLPYWDKVSCILEQYKINHFHTYTQNVDNCLHIGTV